MDSTPGLGRSSGEGNGNPLQYPCLENSLDRGAWRATVQRVTIYSILLGRRRSQWWTCGLRNGFWEGVAGVLSSNLRGLTPGNAEGPRNVQNHLRPWWLGEAPTTGPSRTKAVISPAARSWNHRAEAVCLPPGSCHLRTGWRDHTGTSSVDPPHLQSLCCRGLLISLSPICSLCSPPAQPTANRCGSQERSPQPTHMQISISETVCREPDAKQNVHLRTIRHTGFSEGVPRALWVGLRNHGNVFVYLGEGPHNWLLMAFEDKEGPDHHYSLGTCEPQNLQAGKILSSSLFLFFFFLFWHFYAVIDSLHHLEVLPSFKPESLVLWCIPISSPFSSMELCSCQERNFKGNRDIRFSY